MAGIAVTIKSDQVSGGTGGDTITSQDYANAAAAVTAVGTSGFLQVANPVYAGQTTSLGKAVAIPVSSIREIVSQ